MSVKDYIDSGILEQYVLGITSPEETKDVELMAIAHEVIKQEIDAIARSMEAYAMAGAVQPDAAVKPFLMATIDYTERLKQGEPVSFPPLLNEKSVLAEYAPWLKKEDMVSPGTAGIYAKIIGYTAEAVTAIVWLRDYAPHEVHHHEHERFLIVEGTCDIIVEGEVNSLVAGDYFAIPLHKDHLVKVTSEMPCKVILQRVAA